METLLPFEIRQLSTLCPPSTSRSWQSSPHPYLPFVATACADKTVRIYSLTSFSLLSTITGGHKRSVRCCAWKPSLPSSKRSAESVLATGSFDASAAIWIGCPSGGGEDGDQIRQSIAEDGEGDEADEEDFRFAVVLEGHDSEIKSIAWSAHGTFLATCSRDKSVWIWEALEADSGAIGRGGINGADDEDNYETVAVMQEHDGDVKCVAWHPTEEQCMASGSYDEHIRIWREDIDGEWGCVAVCEGHSGTVWCVEWEPVGASNLRDQEDLRYDSEEPESGPRIMSCSDDLSIRLWKRTPKAKAQLSSGTKIPSIIRSSSDEEEWTEEGQLPRCHERAIYAVSWSRSSRRVVSCGSDGKIVVYEEQQFQRADPDNHTLNGNDEGETLHVNESKTDNGSASLRWRVLAELEAAHGVFEINHVCWAKRFDRNRRGSDEEIIITTGDDGEVKVWTLESN